MSLETPRDVDIARGANVPASSHDSSTPSVYSDPTNLFTDLGDIHEAALSRDCEEETTNPSNIGSQTKEAQQPGLDSPAVEESAEARLERLGRQRPEAFDSLWSEIGFVFSISMSQVLSVGQHPIAVNILLSDPRNTSSPASQSFFPL